MRFVPVGQNNFQGPSVLVEEVIDRKSTNANFDENKSKFGIASVHWEPVSLLSLITHFCCTSSKAILGHGFIHRLSSAH